MYTPLMTKDQLLQTISMIANQSYNAAETGRILFEKFNAMTYGMTDAQILALPQYAGMTPQMLTDIKYAMSSIKELDDAIDGRPVATADRFGYLRPFLLG